VEDDVNMAMNAKTMNVSTVDAKEFHQWENLKHVLLMKIVKFNKNTRIKFISIQDIMYAIRTS
jgi:hypothetical protein